MGLVTNDGERTVGSAAILGDDGLDEFFGNGELSPTFFENENLLLSPNAATADPTVLSPSLVTNPIGSSEAWNPMASTSQSQTIVHRIPQTGAITVQHTVPNGGTTHLVVGPHTYQVQSNPNGDNSSSVTNQSANMVPQQQQQPFAQPVIQATSQQSGQLLHQHGQKYIQSYVQQPQSSQQIMKPTQVQQVTNQPMPQKMV